MADEPELTEGAEGEWVSYLQQWLATLGSYSGEVDGRFGPVTRAAVEHVQDRYGIGGSGAAGAETWNLIAAARDSGPLEAGIEWGDQQLDEVDVPEIGADEEGARA